MRSGARLIRASSADHYALFGALVREYVDALGFPLTFQDLDRELASLPSEYGPPDGAAWIAYAGEVASGIVGLRRFDDTSAEIKRMYVRPAARGMGAGRMLAAAAVAEADALGYARILLDTVAGMTAAIAIYRSLGFEQIAAYRVNPRPDAIFMARTRPGTDEVG